MRKLLLTCLFFISAFQMPTLFASTDSRINQVVVCAPQLQNCLKTIQKIPEARKLINDVQKEGAIRVTLSNEYLSRQFGAFWDPDNRLISVNLSAHRSEGELIGSILFELHNALINSKLDHLDHLAAMGRIDKEYYVESVERLEYYNSKKAAAIAEIGIKSGVFPASARLNTYRNFEEHYHIQKMAGHSAWIAKTYDNLAPKTYHNVRRF